MKVRNINLFMFCFSFIFIINAYPQAEPDNITELRNKWFYGQRRMPLDSIPSNAYWSAIQQKEMLTGSQGYFLSSPSANWTNIGPAPLYPTVHKRLLNSELKEAGYHTVVLDEANFASGVYFYRIEAGDFAESKKMILIE